MKRLIQATTRQLCNRITNPKILVQKNNKYQGNDLDERGINQDKDQDHRTPWRGTGNPSKQDYKTYDQSVFQPVRI